jgi:hypothetical protein
LRHWGGSSLLQDQLAAEQALEAGDDLGPIQAAAYEARLAERVGPWSGPRLGTLTRLAARLVLSSGRLTRHLLLK